MHSDILEIGVSECDGIRVLRLTGELDSYTSSRLVDVSKTWNNNSTAKLIVNLDALQYIDSSGLSTLVSMWVDMNNRGVEMVLSCNNPRIHRILEITGLLKFFTFGYNLEIGPADSVYLPAIRDQKTTSISNAINRIGHV